MSKEMATIIDALLNYEYFYHTILSVIVVVFFFLIYRRYKVKPIIDGLRNLNYSISSQKKILSGNGHTKISTVYKDAKFKIREDSILLYKVNPIVCKDKVEADLESLSNLFNTDLIEVVKEKKGYGNIRYILYKDRLPETYNLNKTPFHSLCVGINNKSEEWIIDTKKNFSFYIAGRTGDGKTVTIKMLIKSFLNSIDYQNNSDDTDIIIFDFKGLDYTDIVNNYGARMIEMNTLENLQKSDNYLKDFIQKFNDSKQILKKHGLVNYEDARAKGIDIPLKRTVFLFDEAGRYLKSSDSSSKEERELKKSLINSVNTMLATIRVSGCPIFLSTQRMNKDEMDIAYDNFTVKVLANLNDEMTRKYQDAKYKSIHLGKGKWTVADDRTQCTLLRTAFEDEPFKNKVCESFKEDEQIEVNAVSKNDYEIIRQSEPRLKKYKATHEVLTVLKDSVETDVLVLKEDDEMKRSLKIKKALKNQVGD